jgi:predicted metal-dependent peptidase
MNMPVSAENPVERLSRLRGEILIQEPFFGILAMSLPWKETGSIPTMATDGKAVLFNPSWIAPLSDAELKGVIVHEVLHCVLQHHKRMQGRQSDRWNAACDYAINPMVLAAGFDLPTGGLLYPAYENLPAEKIYDMLLAGTKDGSAGGTIKAYGSLSEGDGDTALMGEDAIASAKLVSSKTRSAASSKVISRILDEMDSFAHEALPWDVLLKQYINSRVMVKTSFARRNKRFQGDIVMPGRVPDSVTEIVVFVDTSGSIKAPILEKFASAVNDIMAIGLIDVCNVVCGDTEVRWIGTFYRGDDVRLEPKGGGGTRFNSIMARIASEHANAACLVCLSDMECSDFGHDPGIPTLWVRWGDCNKQAPYGSQIDMPQ